MAGEDKRGRFLGLPHDWRRPTRERLKRGTWDPEERQVLVPKVYGWGYGINLYEIARRLRLVRHRRSGE
jgi:hypothetical protein